MKKLEESCLSKPVSRGLGCWLRPVQLQQYKYLNTATFESPNASHIRPCKEASQGATQQAAAEAEQQEILMRALFARLVLCKL